VLAKQAYVLAKQAYVLAKQADVLAGIPDEQPSRHTCIQHQ
jgi:hypothetical protein